MLNEIKQTVNQGLDVLAKPKNNFEKFQLSNQSEIRISRILLIRNGVGSTKKINQWGSYQTALYFDARHLHSSSILYDYSTNNFLRL